MCRPQVDSVRVFLFNTRPTDRGQIAQLVEQRTENPRVGGSIPSLATIYLSKKSLKSPNLKACYQSVYILIKLNVTREVTNFGHL